MIIKKLGYLIEIKNRNKINTWIYQYILNISKHKILRAKIKIYFLVNAWQIEKLQKRKFLQLIPKFNHKIDQIFQRIMGNLKK